MLAVNVLGPLELAWEGVPVALTSRRGRALIAWLGLRESPARRGDVGQLLWPDEEPPRRSHNLRQELYVLRRCAGAEQWLLAEGQTLAVKATTDLGALRRHLREGEGGRARALLRGPCLDDIGDLTPGIADWAEEIRREVDGHLAALGEAEEDTPLRLARILALAGPLAPPVLAGALGTGPEGLRAALEALEREALLADHDLTARARGRILGGMSQLTARAHHERLAQVLEAVDPVAAAAHWARAGSGDRAAALWLRADRPEEALGVARAPALRSAALVAWGARAESAGDAGVLDEVDRQIAAHARETEDPLAVAAASRWRARRLLQGGRADEALDAAEEAVFVARYHGLVDVEAEAQATLGRVLAHHGRWDDAQRAFEAALAGPPRVQLLAYGGLGAICGRRGDLEAATAHHREALGLARDQGDLRAAAVHAFNLGCDLERLGRFAAAEARFREAEQRLGAVGEPRLARLARINLGTTLRHQGRLAEALKALGPEEDGGDDQIAGLAHVLRGEIERAMGDTSGAGRRMRAAAERFSRSGDEHHRALALANAELCDLEEGQGPGPLLTRLIAGEALPGLGALAFTVKADAAAWTGDPAVAEALLAGLPSGLGGEASAWATLARFSLAALRGEALAVEPALVELAQGTGPPATLAAAALEMVRPDGGAGLASAAARLSPGLPEAQARSLARRPRQWRARLEVTRA